MSSLGDLALHVECGRVLVIRHRLATRTLRLMLDHVSVEHDHAAGETCVRITGDGTETCLLRGPDWRASLYRIGNALHRAGYLFQEAQMMDFLERIENATTTLREGKDKLLTSRIEDLMEAVDRARSEIVPCLMGPSGIGKTEGIEAFAKRHGRQVVHLIASQVLPTEVSGMTMPNQETHSMDVFDHSRISHMKDGDILFLDELLKGQQQVLSACLTMVQERRLMSGTPLPDVIIVAAANPLASPKMLPLEIRQRFLFVNVEFDNRSWCSYMQEHGVPRPENIVRRLETRHEGDDWNTLTPRTATKLMLWLRSAIGTESERMVRSVIIDMFGRDVLNDMATSLVDYDRKEETRSPLDQVTDRMSELIGGLPATSDPSEAAERQTLLADMSRMSRTRDCSSVSDLLERIGKLSGGSEILRALGEETISMPNDI